MYVVLYGVIIYTWILEIGQDAKKRFSCEHNANLVMLLEVMPNNKTYVKAKDAYNSDYVQANRTHVIT